MARKDERKHATRIDGRIWEEKVGLVSLDI